jgi:DNA-binding NarL/FixJ family response regulator
MGAIAEGPRRLECFEEAVAALALTPARLEHASALIGLGGALRRQRRPSDARGPLREALAMAREAGATPLAERAHAELEATGARPRKIVRSGIDQLTSSERRVAELATAGMTNREIAQSLFVTVKTVETHLHHAFQKLEVGSRRDLAGALTQDQ